MKELPPIIREKICDRQAGLREVNFRKVSTNGFGDPLNSYPHSMMWFREKLYVATTRANLHLLWFTIGDRVRNFQIWPVEHPEAPYDLDLRAQIWCYDPVEDVWENLYVSPMIRGSEGFDVPLAIGFRGMAIHQAPDDEGPALYIPTWSPRLGPGPVLLRSRDGVVFEQISEPGLGDPTVTTIRSVVSFKGKLFIAPTGTTKNHFSANIPDRLVIMAGTSLEKNDWQLACEPYFGDKTNEGVFCMAVYNGYLYAGTVNGEEGFQVWKTKGEGELPYTWTQVLACGGYRGKENQGAVSMAVFKGSLYIGGGILGGYDRPRNIGPASPELIRVHSDDTWDLIVGETRLTPEGLKVSLSGLGSGFNSPTPGYFWQMCEHEGWLYLGTYDMTNWLPFFHPENMPARVRRFIEDFGVDVIVENYAGFDLWRSGDGNRWVPVSRNGFGNHYNFGIRTMVSSPYGFFVGATNPFGTKVATRRLGGWNYEDNPQGGLEIWLGKSESLHGIRVGDGFDHHDDALIEKYVLPGIEMDPEEVRRRGELLIEEFYEHSGFRHCGFWSKRADTPKKSCINLMRELLFFITAENSRILEIGCGKGATTSVVVKHLPGAAISTLAMSKEDRKECKMRLPDIDCRHLKGNRLRYASESFDYVISVEGLCGKQELLPEIFRALKSGGRFVFTDLIVESNFDGYPKSKNVASSLGELHSILRSAGFNEIALHDITVPCAHRYHEAVHRDFRNQVLAKTINMEIFDQVLSRLPGAGQMINYYAMGIVGKV